MLTSECSTHDGRSRELFADDLRPFGSNVSYGA
jgi:hypothetical protein